MQRIVMILVIVAGAWGSAICTGSVHIYSSGNFSLLIPSPDEPESEYGRGWMADAIIEIPDHIVISDLDIGVILAHESLFDLQILLQSPVGTNVALNLAGNLAFIVRGEDGGLTAVGGSGKLIFDDEADVSIEQATEPFFSSYRPVWDLSLLDNEDAYGPWRLRVYDAFYADTGTLNSFELVITSPEPATAVLLILGFSLMTLLNHPRKI
jgi:subtilisin-like proprotein convertase family protein